MTKTRTVPWLLGMCLGTGLLVGLGIPVRRQAAPTRPALEQSVLSALERIADVDLRRQVLEACQAARLADARSRLWSRRDRAAADESWTVAMVAVRDAWMEQRRRDRAAWDRWQAARDRAQALLRTARTPDHPLLDESYLAALRSAEVAWDRAERRAESGDLVAAAAAADQVADSATAAMAVWDQSHSRYRRADEQRQWTAWVRQAVEDSRREGTAVIVDKLRRVLQVWRHGKPGESYPAELGRHGLERKLRAGDRATPEGRYRVTEVRVAPHTRYFKALLLDYPNATDRSRLDAAIRRGLAPRGSRPGGLIEIHGDGGRGQDWTDGCVALRNDDIDALWPIARKGLSVTIVGTVPSP